MTAKSFTVPASSTEKLLLLAVVTIASCTFAALFSAWSWPIVGDSSLMRYVVFLLERGHAPYSQIIDINLPGSYLLEATAMRVFGRGATGLRLYDAALSTAVCSCAVLLSKSGLRSRLCALAGGFLIVLIHLRDGLIQAGQRDYAILVIVLMAYVLLLRGPSAKTWAGTWLFGFMAGCTVTIKPTMLILILLPVYALFLQHEEPSTAVKKFSGAFIAFLIPLAAMFLWLRTWHAIPAFFSSMDLARRSHSGLAHKTPVFLLVHSIHPVAILLGFGILLLALRGFTLDDESKLLLFGAAAGLGSFMMQGKGFPYQRYPFLGLIIIVIFGLLADELIARPLNRALATVSLALSCFWWAPKFALDVSRYDHVAPFEDHLAQSLLALHVRSGDVQCLDTVGGCVNVLYDQNLVQSTGYLYDCYAYAGPADARNSYRMSFLTALEIARPRYIILTSESCLDARGRIERINDWPAMRQYMSQNYAVTTSWQTVQALHWWNQSETPPSFEIFARK